MSPKGRHAIWRTRPSAISMPETTWRRPASFNEPSRLRKSLCWQSGRLGPWSSVVNWSRRPSFTGRPCYLRRTIFGSATPSNRRRQTQQESSVNCSREFLNFASNSMVPRRTTSSSRSTTSRSRPRCSGSIFRAIPARGTSWASGVQRSWSRRSISTKANARMRC